MTEATVSRAILRRTLVNVLSEGELNTLAFDLDVDYERLPGDGKDNKVRELILHCERLGLVPVLIENLKLIRPDVVLTPGIAPNKSREVEGELIYIPRELRLGYSDRRMTLASSQLMLLEILEASGLTPISRDELAERIGAHSEWEIVYRLEHLRLLGFISRPEEPVEGAANTKYHLSQSYHKHIISINGLKGWIEVDGNRRFTGLKSRIEPKPGARKKKDT